MTTNAGSFQRPTQGKGQPQVLRRISNKPAPLNRRSTSSKNHKSLTSPTKEEKFAAETYEIMTGSFLQYCAVCEKQMIVPTSSVLFCSESCRRKDSNHSSSYPLFKTDMGSPASTLATPAVEDLAVRDIVSQRSPTTLTSQPAISIRSEGSDSEDGSIDTEASEKRLSEAKLYLRQFQSAAALARTPTRTPRPPRPRHESRNSMTLLSSTPSLSHTPTSLASPSFPFTPSSRPLPSRHHPHSLSYSSRSVELVTPVTHYSTAPSSFEGNALLQQRPAVTVADTGTRQGELKYIKKRTQSMNQSPGHSNLKQLLVRAEEA